MTSRSPTADPQAPLHHAQHFLKASPEDFAAILDGRKRHMIVWSSRPVRVGEILDISEHEHPDRTHRVGAEVALSHRFRRARVTHVTDARNPCQMSRHCLDPEAAVVTIEVLR